MLVQGLSENSPRIQVLNIIDENVYDQLDNEVKPPLKPSSVSLIASNRESLGV